MSRDRRKVFRRSGHYNLHLSTPGMQPPCAHQRSTPVPACSCKYNHSFALRVTIQEAYSGEVRQVAPCIFHHLDQLNAQILHHRPVYFDHLLGSHVREVVWVDWKSHALSPASNIGLLLDVNTKVKETI